jgi:hypothetical protein
MVLAVSRSNLAVSVSPNNLSAKPGAFAAHAARYAAMGLTSCPVEFVDGRKKPTITHPDRLKPTSFQALLNKHRNAGLGVVLDPAAGRALTVVDIDETEPRRARAALRSVVDTFGETPAIASTPSGGLHCYYETGDAPAQRKVRWHGSDFAVDVLGKGIVVAPPTRRPNGRAYELMGQCDLGVLAALPPIRLPPSLQHAVDQRHPAKGERNNTLFRSALFGAHACRSVEELAAFCAELNDNCSPPLPEHEVSQIATNAWRYQVEGRNWVGQRARTITTADEFERLDYNADAQMLLTEIRLAHGGRQGPFAMAAKAHAPKLRWSPARYRAARSALITMGFIAAVYQGGRRGNDPSLFVLSR